MSATAQDVLARLRQENQAKLMLESLRAQQGAQTSPFQIPAPPQTNSFVPPVAPMGVPMVGDSFSGADRAAAAKGVDVTSGGGIDRTLLGFAPNEAFEQSFTKELLTKRYGQDVPVRIGEDSKQVEFLNPKTKRWTTVDEAGFSKADLKDLYGPGIVATGAAIGGVLGAPGGPLGVGVGGGAGSALSDYIRLSIGKSKGVHNLSEVDMMNHALKTGGVDAVLGTLGEKGVHLLQLMKRFVRPNAIKPEEAKMYLEQFDAAWKEVEGLKQGGAEGFQPNVPNVIGNEKLAGELQTATQGNRQSRQEMAAIDERNATALDKYFDTQFSPADQAAQTRLGTQVQETNKGVIDQKAYQSEQEAADQLSRVKQEVSKLPVYDEGALGESARRIVADARTKLSASEKEAWKGYETSIGFNPASHSSNYGMPITGDSAASIKALIAEQKGALLDFQKSHLGQVLGKDIVESALSGKSIDLANVDTAIKELRSRIRDARNGTLQSDLSTAKMEKVAGALADARAEFLKKTDPSALKALEEAEAASRLKHETVDNSALGFILRKKGDAYVLYNDEVFRKIFLANDVNAVRELMGLAKEPAQKLAIQNSMWAMYREEAMKNGIPNPALHDRFLSKYGDMLKEAFGKDYLDKVVPFGEMGDAIVKSAEQSASYMKFLRTGLSKRIDNANPDNLIGEVLFGKKTSLSDVGKLAAEMKRVGNYQSGVEALGGYIRKNAVDASGNFSESAIRELVLKHASAIDAFAGPGYSKTLIRFANGLKMAKPIPAGVRKETDTTLYHIIRRAIIPPLSREGRVVTVVRQGVDKRADRVLFEILTDPEKLREFVRLGDRRMTDRKVAAFLASVGGSSLASEALND